MRINWFLIAFFAVTAILICTSVVLMIFHFKKRGSKWKYAVLAIPGLVAIAGCLLVFLTLNSWSSEKDYQEDLIIAVPDSEVQIVIKEWSWLQGSGAQVYQLRNGSEVYLGDAGGADDGYCPFANGEYEIVNNQDGTFTLKWNDRTESPWREKTFHFEK